MDALARLPPSVTLLAGPQLLGFMFAWALQGVLSVQVYIYHLYFPDDRYSMKWLVYGLFVWEWAQLGLVTQAAFEFNVYHYGDISNLTQFHNTWFSVPVMTALTACVVQCYYAWRIWVLSRSKILVGGISFLSVAQMVLGVAGGVTLQTDGVNAIARDSRQRPILVSSIIIALVVDIVIAAVNSHLLLRSKSGVTKQSDDIVKKLVRLGIETGAVTATVAFVYVVLFMINANNLLFECPALVLPKLYANTLVVSLNNRMFIRNELLRPTQLFPLSSHADRRRHPGGSSSTVAGNKNKNKSPALDFARSHDGTCSELEMRIEVVEDTYVTRDSLGPGGAVPQKQKAALELVPMDVTPGELERARRAQYGDVYRVTV